MVDACHTEDELRAELEQLRQENAALKRERDEGSEEARLLEDLRVHQIELEAQNRELREAQSALEESRSRYADLYDFAPVAYATLDRKGVIREINLTGAALLGRDRATIVDMPLLALVQMDPAGLSSHLRRCAELRARVASELVISIPKDGSRIVQVVSVPEASATGEVERFRTTFIDVTELRRAEAESRRAHEAERALRERFEALDRASVLVSRALLDYRRLGLSGVLQTVVDEARAMTGADIAALGVGQDPEKPFDPWVESGTGGAVWEALGRPPRPVGVLGLIAREGALIRVKDVRAHPSFRGWPPGHPAVTSFIGVPIRHEQRHIGSLYLANKRGAEEFSEDDLRATEMLAYRVGIALEIARLSEIEARERSRLTTLAEAGRALAGTRSRPALLRAAAHLALPWLADWSVVCCVEEERFVASGMAHADPAREGDMAEIARRHEVRVDDERSPLPQAWRTGQSVLLDKAGVAAREAALEDAELIRRAQALAARSALFVPVEVRGHVAAILCLVYAASGRHYTPEDILRAEEVAQRIGLALENAQLFEEAQAAVRTRDNLLAIVSHDLRNALSAIRFSAALLERPAKAGAPPSGRRQLDVIARGVDRMNRLLEDLLAAATIEAGRFTVEPRPEEVPPMLEDLIQMMEAVAAPKSLRLERDVPAELPAIRCDRARVQQVLSNLVGNAIKFAPKGSAIRIAAAPSAREVRFAVSDQGPGIAEEEVEHLFDRYWRGGTDGATGAGLGLYIAKGIVDAHGGRIWVETQAGAGATFCFTLPVAA